MCVYTYYGTPTLHTQEHPHNVALVGMCVCMCVFVCVCMMYVCEYVSACLL